MPLTPEISQIIRSKRKTYSLEVKPDGQLIVRAPESATRAEINAIVKAKAAWIAKTRTRLAARAEMHPPKTFTSGEIFWYLGKQYPLCLTDRRHPLLDLDGSFNLARHMSDRARDVFIAWYREETRQITHNLIASYVDRYGFNVNAVSITSAHTRWGSCSGKGNLNFTYRLCMAPFSVVESVVVHELVHLMVPNHSQKFWNEVARINPGYPQSRAWLKQNGHLLTLD